MTATRKDHQNRIKIGKKKKIAFVCSGGALKAGAFHLGVALALKEHGFSFYGGIHQDEGESPPPNPMEVSTYVGSSAGAITVSYLASGYSLDTIFNSYLAQDDPSGVPGLPRLSYQKMFKLRPELAKEQWTQLLSLKGTLGKLFRGNFDAIFQLPKIKATGLFSTAGIEQYMREEVLPSNQFQDFRSDLFIVGTQLNHSRKVVFGKHHYNPPPHDLTCQYHNQTPIADACAASTALPFIFAPYPIHNSDGTTNYYIDGEIRDTLSTHVAVDSGCDLIIASYTHQPYHFTQSVGSLTEYGLPAILIQSIYLLIEQKINERVHDIQLRSNALLAVERFCKHEGLDPSLIRRICEVLENELHYRKNVDTLYIHPRASDHQMFLREHFSLSPKKMGAIVRSGFLAGLDVLRHYEFEDAPRKDSSSQK